MPEVGERATMVGWHESCLQGAFFETGKEIYKQQMYIIFRTKWMY